MLNVNKSETEEKKQQGFTKEILDYLKKNPSVAIAVVSAAITIMSVISSYAGRLANVAYLKYWGIDSLYATIETKGVMYRVSNAIIWFVSIFIIGTLLQKVFVKYCHFSTPIFYLKKESRKSSKKEKAVISEKLQIDIIVAYFWKMRLLGCLCLAAIILFLIIWLSTTAITSIEILSAAFQTISVWGFVTFLSYHSTKNQRDAIKTGFKNHSDISVLERFKRAREIETTQFELNQVLHGLNFEGILYGLFILISMILISMPVEGYLNARLSQTFLIVTENGRSEAILFHGDDTYILEEAKIDENTIVIDTSKQRILKTDDISFEKRTFESVVKK